MTKVLDWTNARGADPQLLAEFLEGVLERAGIELQRRDIDPAGASLCRALKRWSEPGGDPVRFSTVDRWAVYLGLHVSDFPDEIWLEWADAKAHTNPYRSRAKKKAAA